MTEKIQEIAKNYLDLRKRGMDQKNAQSKIIQKMGITKREFYESLFWLNENEKSYTLNITDKIKEASQ